MYALFCKYERIVMNDENILPYSFKPGQSGNPKGRPKGSVSVTKFMKELLDTKISIPKTQFTSEGERIPASKALAIRIVTGAIKGDNSKIRELLDRVEGKTKDVLEIENTEKVDADDVYSDIRKRLSNARKGPKTPKPKKSTSKKAK